MQLIMNHSRFDRRSRVQYRRLRTKTCTTSVLLGHNWTNGCHPLQFCQYVRGKAHQKRWRHQRWQCRMSVRTFVFSIWLGCVELCMLMIALIHPERVKILCPRGRHLPSRVRTRDNRHLTCFARAQRVLRLFFECNTGAVQLVTHCTTR